VPRYVRDYGAPSFKIFMNNRGGEGTRLGLPDIDDGFLMRLCEAAAANNGIVCPHPETIELAFVLRERVKARDPQGTGGLKTWNATRPPFVEADAVQRAAYIAMVAGSPLHVVHTSSGEALDAALRLRFAGADVSIETCPHYLTHDEDWEGGDIGKINPPLRAAADCEALWEGVLSGEVDTIGTDHVHRDLSSKTGGIWTASPRMSGPRDVPAGPDQRGLSQARPAAGAARRPDGDQPRPYHGAVACEGRDRSGARCRSDIR
jgi:dihydroorotase-like cyclic amidohydrolase